MGRVRCWGAAVVACALLFVACGDDGASSDSSRLPSTGSGSSGFAPSAAAGTGSTGAPASTPAAQTTSGAAAPLTQPKDIVYTGSLDVRVDDVSRATDDAQRRVDSSGGYLFSRQSSSTNGAPSATLVFKVPPASFLATLDQLATLGTEVGRSVRTDDVTAQVVDLEARLKTATASVDRTRDLLARATSVADIVTLESEMAKRETVVEQLQGQLRVVRSQVAAGTITLTIGEKLKAAKPSPSDDIASPLDGLRAGSVALVNTGQVVALVVFALAPWLPFVAGAWWIGRRLSRRVARRRAAALAAIPAPPAAWFARPASPPPPRPAAPAAPAAAAPATEAGTVMTHPGVDPAESAAPTGPRTTIDPPSEPSAVGRDDPDE